MSTFEERRAARAAWPIRRFALGEEPEIDALDTSTVDERIAAVSELTLRTWALAGREIPTYSRATMPGRVIRPKR